LKRLCIFLLLIVAANFSRAQYTGGSGDGSSVSQVTNQNPLPNIYHGGSDDGVSNSSVTNQNPLPNIYHGGNDDGSSNSSVTNQNPLPNIYHGGSDDGSSNSSVTNQNPLPNIYHGGNDDGTSNSSVTNQNPLPNIYHGGSDDGSANSSVTNLNPLPNIYTGGNDDGSSNASVTNQNPQPFVITCPNNITVQCINESPCPANVTEFLLLPGASVTGFCSSNLNIVCNTILTTGNNCSGTFTRTCTVSDDCGNSTTCSQIITVLDNTKPTASNPASVNVQCIANIPAANINVVTDEADNCSTPTVALQSELNNGGTGCPGNPFIVTRTYRVTDACGNSIDVTQTLTALDNTKPTASNPASVNVQCIANIPAASINVVIDEADNCSTPTVALQNEINNGGSGCLGNPYIVTRTYRVTDACSNFIDVIQTLTAFDNTKPTASNPASVNVQCVANIPAANINVVTDEADNCSSPTVALHSEINNGGTGCPGNPFIVTRTYRVTDACGNSIDVVQTLTALDNTKPTASNPAPVNVQCISNIPAANTNVVTDEADNCSTATVALHSEINNGGTGCPGSPYIVTRTYRVTDACGNSIDVTQTLTVLDNTKPTASNPASVNVQCISNIPVANINVVIDEADNCSTPTVALHSEINNGGTGCTGNPFIVTRTYRVTDACGNSIDVVQTLTALDNTKPVIAGCKTSTSRLLDLNETNYTVQGNEFNVTATDNCSLSSLTYNLSGATSGSGTSLNNIDLLTGVTTVTWTATDACGNTQTCLFTVTVNKRPTIIDYTGDNDEQYSDNTNLSAILKDQLTNTALNNKTINFAPGSQNTSAVTNGSGIASATMNIFQNVGHYNVTASFGGDAIYTASSATEGYDILKENASVEYTGPEFVSVPCTTCATTTILLSALLKDTTSGTPPGDLYPGDIRKARVKFVDLNSLANLSGWLSPGLVNPADTTRGLVTYLWTVTLPTTSYDTYSIGVIIDGDNNGIGNYIGYAQTVINVSRSSLTEFITGGGHINPTASGGSYISDVAKNVNFGFNVKWNKSNKNLLGKVNIIFRKGTQVYQIKSTSITSLSINSTDPCSKKATFISKANLQNVTNPNLAPVSVLGNLDLQMDLVDNGEPGTNNDRIGISLFNGNTLVYSSNIPYNVTLPLKGGNIEVHNGVNCPNSSTKVSNNMSAENMEMKTTPEEIPFTVKAWPNPTESNFTLQVLSNSNEKIEITVFDISGKLLKKLNGNAEQLFRFGYEWKAGSYVAIIRQGQKQKTIKLIKQ
jgi:hypothetical protein